MIVNKANQRTALRFINSKVESKNSFSAALFFALILIYTFACVYHMFTETIERGIQVITIAVLLVYAVLNIGKTRMVSKIGMSVLVFSGYVLSYRAIGYSQAGWGNMMMQISFFCAIMVPIYFQNKMNRKLAIFLYYSILSLLSVALIRDALLFRLIGYYGMVNFVEMTEMGSNVALTAFSTMTLFLYCTSLLVFFNTSKIIVKVIHAVIMAFSFYYVIFCSMRGSVVILLFLATVLLLYQKFSNKNSMLKFIGVITILMIMLALLMDTNTIFDFFEGISPNERLAARVNDLRDVSNSGLSEDSFSGRYSLELISIGSWLKNPLTFLFGIGDQRLSEYGIEGFVMSGVGGHSEIIDSLARFGIIGFAVIAMLFYRITTFVLSLFSPDVRKQVKMIIVIFILTALTKAVLLDIIGIVFLIFFPMSSFIINKYKQIS